LAQCTLAITLTTAVAALAGGLAGYYAASRSTRGLRAAVRALLAGAARERDVARAARRLSSRPRRRYLVFEVIPGGVGENELRRSLEEAARRLAGEAGLALSALTLVEYSESTSRGIIRFRHEYKALALAVLGLVREVNGSRVVLVPLATTGSLRRARRLLS